MRRSLLLAVVFVSSCLGCCRFAGPVAVRHMDRADSPCYTIEEQQRRGRERLAITEDDRAIGPNAYIDRPSPTGR